MTVRAEIDGAARACCAAAAASRSGAEFRSMQNRLTWVLRAVGPGWFIVHEHTSAPAAGHDGTVILSRPPRE